LTVRALRFTHTGTQRKGLAEGNTSHGAVRPRRTAVKRTDSRGRVAWPFLPDYNRVYCTSITYCFFYCYVLKLSSTGRVTRVFSTHFAFPRHLFGDLGIIQWIPVLKRARRILVCPVHHSDRLRPVFNTFTLPSASVSERSMTLVRLQQVQDELVREYSDQMFDGSSAVQVQCRGSLIIPSKFKENGRRYRIFQLVVDFEEDDWKNWFL
jgi:hypothetical protein